jgi:hypothetical protein
MADGVRKKIEDIRVGDKVTATYPISGKSFEKMVVALHRNRDTYMADITVRTVDGRESVIHTTQEHPFWDTTRRTWVSAAALAVGDVLRGTDRSPSFVVKTRDFIGSRDMYNVTVDAVHTYYVMAGDTPILVHNAGCWSTRYEKARDLFGKYREGQSTRDPSSQWYHEELDKDELLRAINNAAEGDGIAVSRNGQILGGHHRWDELRTRINDGRIDPDTLIRIDVYGGE